VRVAASRISERKDVGESRSESPAGVGPPANSRLIRGQYHLSTARNASRPNYVSPQQRLPAQSDNPTADRPSADRRSTLKRGLVKVPEITVYFWVIKVLTTGMGEATSDFLVHRMPPPVAVLLGGVVLAVAMWLQLAAARYRAAVYWFAVVMVAVFGTMAADVLHIGLHVPYVASSLFFAISLAVIFVVWHRSEGTVSIHSICTRRRELFYWSAVMATFALGTAAGDMTARTLGLGYLGSGIIFAGLIAIPAVGWRWFRLDPIVAFWFAYIVTRPLGASFADWMGVPRALGGLDWGRGNVSIGLTIPIVMLVSYLVYTRLDVQQDDAAPA
jgi:uncharacterized membrane-anchored protein